MSVNTHKSWHIHREVNKERIRRLQDELKTAKDKSAKGLEEILNGEHLTTSELLGQIHKLGEPSPLDPVVSNSNNVPIPITTIAPNDELSRFDPLIYPIELDVPAEEPTLKKQHQNCIGKERSSNTSNDQNTVSAATNRPVGQANCGTQDGLIKELRGSLSHSSHDFRRDSKRGPAHSASHLTHLDKHAAVTHESSSKKAKLQSAPRASFRR